MRIRRPKPRGTISDRRLPAADRRRAQDGGQRRGCGAAAADVASHSDPQAGNAAAAGGDGGDFAQRRQFVSDAADGMAVDAVLDILKAAAETSHETISHSLVRLLSKLAAHAEAGAAPVRPQADAALREQVQRLLAGWTLTDPNPGAYGAALQRMARAAPAGAPPRTDHHVTEPDRLVAMALEIGTMGPRLHAAVDRVVAEGRLAQLLDALEGGVADSAAAATVRAQIATAAAVQQIVARE